MLTRCIILRALGDLDRKVVAGQIRRVKDASHCSIGCGVSSDALRRWGVLEYQTITASSHALVTRSHPEYLGSVGLSSVITRTVHFLHRCQEWYPSRYMSASLRPLKLTVQNLAAIPGDAHSLPKQQVSFIAIGVIIAVHG